MSDPFVVTDDLGDVRYTVTMPDYVEVLSLADAGGTELAALTQAPEARRLRVRITGQDVADVRSRGQFNRQYWADTAGGRLRALGSVYYGVYFLSPDSQVESAVARVERALNWTGSKTWVRLVIADNADPVLLTAIVLGMEYLCYSPTLGESLMRRGSAAARTTVPSVRSPQAAGGPQ